MYNELIREDEIREALAMKSDALQYEAARQL